MSLPNACFPKDLVRLLVEAKSDLEIAAALGITHRTVRFHMTNIFERLGVSSPGEVILACLDSMAGPVG